MMLRRLFFLVGLAFGSAALQIPAHGAVSVTFATPADNQGYAVGVGINYTGSGSWVVGTDRTTANVTVDLVWYDPNNLTGQGVITDSDSPALSYSFDSRGNYTGSYSFSNTTDGEGDSRMIATPYHSNSTQYFLRATPFNFKGDTYLLPSGAYYCAYKQLGTID